MTNLDQQIAATISTISHEQAAKLLRISPEELTKLVDAEIILSAGSGIYSASTIVLNYIEYLRDQIEQKNCTTKSDP
jgi:hypothetical protein